jgi:2-polyprenyl-3-methyl-5-hydroxy-6-metoxy-1,4-benzoquinol methylase
MTDQNRTASYFDTHAAEFSAMYGSQRSWIDRLIDRFFRISMRLRFERTIAECRPLDGRFVLDVGCGPGQYAITLARRGAGQVVGIDFASAMIQLAKKQAIDSGVGDRIELIAGDFADFNFDRTFDYVIMMGFMDYIEDPATVVARAVSLATAKALFSFPAAEGILARQRRFRYRNRCYLRLYTRSEVEQLFSGLANCEVTIDKLSRDYYVTVRKI